MKLVPWVLTAVLLLLARAFATSTPPGRDFASLNRDAQVGGSQQNGGIAKQAGENFTPLGGSAKQQSENIQTTGSDCKAAGPAVVTIHAGRSFGSGSVVSSEGLVITNNHVVQPAMDGQVGVRTIAGKRYQGQVIGSDPVNDLALIKLSTQDRLPVIQMANSQNSQTGQKVCAIGSPYGQAGVLTRGTLTTVRSNGDLQSALLLEPGNSGGPLLNQNGEMIGINKAIWQSRNGVNSGISFATNLMVAKNFIEKNRSNTSVIASRPGFNSGFRGSRMTPDRPEEQPPFSPFPFSPDPSRGMDGGQLPFSDFPPQPPNDHFGGPPERLAEQHSGPRLGVVLDNETMVIKDVMPNSAAGVAGIQPGDRLIAMDGSQVQGVEQVQEFLSSQPNSTRVTIKRNQRTQDIQVNFQ
ncbi:MAG: trypsin-like peptidase domain-containing protein [Kovacikia sp.]